MDLTILLCETLYITLLNAVVQLFIINHRVTLSENTEFLGSLRLNV